MNTAPNASEKKSTRLIWIVAIVILLIVIWLFMNSGNPSSTNTTTGLSTSNPPASVQGGNDTSAAITKDLNSVQVGDVNGDFQSIDSDLKSL